MRPTLDRRGFLGAAAALTVSYPIAAATKEPAFKISLAEWSLHRGLQGKTQPKLDPLDFAKMAKNDYQIDNIEYVNSFYKELIKKPGLDKELRKRADDLGVRSVLIMCDGEGNLGDPDNLKRQQAVDNHKKWLELAKALGCHSIRVNAYSDKKLSPDEQAKLVSDGLRKLCEIGDTFGLFVIVENHDKQSSNGDWLVSVMKMVDHKRIGTLPDFGNFKDYYDRYLGTQQMMPYAKGVSAKSHDFDESGNETHTDYNRMMTIVLDAGYHSFVGIEYEGEKLSEPDGIRATKRLLEKILAAHA